MTQNANLIVVIMMHILKQNCKGNYCTETQQSTIFISDVYVYFSCVHSFILFYFFKITVSNFTPSPKKVLFSGWFVCSTITDMIKIWLKGKHGPRNIKFCRYHSQVQVILWCSQHIFDKTSYNFHFRTGTILILPQS